MAHKMSAKGGSASGGKYFFVLGSNPALSLAELSSVFSLDKIPANEYWLTDKGEVFIADLENFDPALMIKKLGGTIKIGKVMKNVGRNEDAMAVELAEMIEKKKDGKFNYGISYYGKKRLNTKVIGMEIKKHLKEKNINSRWVTSREPVLSSVVVEQNKLTSGGAEFVLIDTADGLAAGITNVVQPFKELSFRDYGRPARDDLSGMLPPKLAQIMINLAGVKPNDTILDPFCGSGTILTEAMLMGFTDLIGSDISAKAIEDTRKNIEWTRKNFQFLIFNFQLFNVDARYLSKNLKLNSINAIITEPFLGPQRGKVDIQKTKKELKKLYSDCLSEFKKILVPEGKVVMIWPVFRRNEISHNLFPDLNGYKIINPLPRDLVSNKKINLTDRQTIIYGRSDQKVWREIVVLALDN